VADSNEHNNETSGSIKGREFLGYQGNCKQVSKDSAPHKWLVG